MVLLSCVLPLYRTSAFVVTDSLLYCRESIFEIHNWSVALSYMCSFEHCLDKKHHHTDEWAWTEEEKNQTTRGNKKPWTGRAWFHVRSGTKEQRWWLPWKKSKRLSFVISSSGLALEIALVLLFVHFYDQGSCFGCYFGAIHLQLHPQFTAFHYPIILLHKKSVQIMFVFMLCLILLHKNLSTISNSINWLSKQKG